MRSNKGPRKSRRKSPMGSRRKGQTKKRTKRVKKTRTNVRNRKSAKHSKKKVSRRNRRSFVKKSRKLTKRRMKGGETEGQELTMDQMVARYVGLLEGTTPEAGEKSLGSLAAETKKLSLEVHAPANSVTFNCTEYDSKSGMYRIVVTIKGQGALGTDEWEIDQTVFRDFKSIMYFMEKMGGQALADEAKKAAKKAAEIASQQRARTTERAGEKKAASFPCPMRAAGVERGQGVMAAAKRMAEEAMNLSGNGGEVYGVTWINELLKKVSDKFPGQVIEDDHGGAKVFSRCSPVNFAEVMFHPIKYDVKPFPPWDEDVDGEVLFTGGATHYPYAMYDVFGEFIFDDRYSGFELMRQNILKYGSNDPNLNTTLRALNFPEKTLTARDETTIENRQSQIANWLRGVIRVMDTKDKSGKYMYPDLIDFVTSYFRNRVYKWPMSFMVENLKDKELDTL